MKTFTQEFKELVESKLRPQNTVGEIWELCKTCSKELKVNERNDLGHYSFIMSFLKDDREMESQLRKCKLDPIINFNITLYFMIVKTPKGKTVDHNSSVGCDFKIKEEELVEGFIDEDVEYEGSEYGDNLDLIFSKLESWNVFNHLKNQVIEYKLDGSKNLEIEMVDQDDKFQ